MSILFKGNLEEGNYTLIKSTDGWVLKGETSYVGFNFADRKDEPQRGYMWTCPKCGTENHSDFTKCPCCGEPKDEPQKKEVEWVYNKRERLWYPYSNGELLFKDEPTISKMEQVKGEQTERSRR